jgi:hypothetical protein
MSCTHGQVSAVHSVYPPAQYGVLQARQHRRTHQGGIMKLHRTNRLTGLLLAGAAAVAVVGLSSAPAQAASITGTTFTVTLTSGNGATIKTCYTLNPATFDVTGAVAYDERVHVHGQDSVNDDHLDYMGSTIRRVFTSTSPQTHCRTKTYSDRSILNEDSIGQDELYTMIELNPVDPTLNTVTKNSPVVQVGI